MARRSQKSTEAGFESSLQAIRKRFIEPGRTYLDVTASTSKHMHYSGLTLDGNEVDNHIVVDFNEAFLSSNVVHRPRLENFITPGQSLGGPTIDNESLPVATPIVANANLFAKKNSQNSSAVANVPRI